MLNNGNKVTINKKYELNIDPYLILIENIMIKYDNYDVPGTVFVKGKREPVSNRTNLDIYKRLGVVSTTPWHPFISIPLFKDMLEYYQYKHTAVPELFKINKLCNGIELYHTTNKITDNSIIINYIPNITPDDCMDISNIFLELYNNHLKDIYINNPNSVYMLECMTDRYYLLDYGDVRIYRYEEVLDANKHNT